MTQEGKKSIQGLFKRNTSRSCPSGGNWVRTHQLLSITGCGLPLGCGSTLASLACSNESSRPQAGRKNTSTCIGIVSVKEI